MDMVWGAVWMRVLITSMGKMAAQDSRPAKPPDSSRTQEGSPEMTAVYVMRLALPGSGSQARTR